MISARLRGPIGLAFHRQQRLDQRFRRRRQAHPSAADHTTAVVQAVEGVGQVAPVQHLQLAPGECLDEGFFSPQSDGVARAHEAAVFVKREEVGQLAKVRGVPGIRWENRDFKGLLISSTKHCWFM